MNRPTERKAHRAFAPTRRFWLYLLLLAVALFFTQALRSKVSALLFWFLLLLPLPMLLSLPMARRGLCVSAEPLTRTLQKGDPCAFALTVRNRTILPFPFLELHISLPQENAVRCKTQVSPLSLSPRASVCLKDTVTFRYRGSYRIAVTELYAYDLLRLFRVRVPVTASSAVSILPRLPVRAPHLAAAVADRDQQDGRSTTVVGYAELADIRPYRVGDPLNSIHWKLSAKEGDYVVKEQRAGDRAEVVLFPNLSAHYPATPPPDCPEALRPIHTDAYEDMNELTADGVVDITLSRAAAELAVGHIVHLYWQDARYRHSLRSLRLTSAQDLERMRTTFGTAPLPPADASFAEAAATVRADRRAGDGSHRVYILPAPEDEQAVAGYAAHRQEPFEVLLYEPTERFASPTERNKLLRDFRHRIEAAGGQLTICRSSDLRTLPREGGDSHAV